jgi:hypothetical protein
MSKQTTAQAHVAENSPFDISPYVDTCQHAWAMCGDAWSTGYRLQTAFWQLAGEAIKAQMALDHVWIVGAALPDPLTDRSLWWSAEQLTNPWGTT